jgi:PPP family 3-phenylpropionic acid transporter
MTHSNPTIVNDSFAWRLALVYAAFFAVVGWHLPLFPLWLSSRGLDPAAIGIVLAAMQAVRVVGTPLGTRIADRYGSLRGAIVITAVASMAAIALVGSASGFALILIAAVTLAFVSAPVLPLTDAYGLKGLAQRGRSYGPVRLWGSVAFIAGNVGAGFILEAIAPGHLIWLIVFALMLVVAAASALDPVEVGSSPVAAAPPIQSPKILLCNPGFIAVVLASSMIQSSHALYYGFSTMDWRAGGLDGTVIGMLWGLGVAAEIVLFAFSGRLPKSLRPTTLLAIGGLGAIVRWTAMAFDPPTAMLPALQILHAASFGAAHLGMMGFLARAVPRELAATAQGVSATWSGIVSASATFASGFVYAASGSLAYLLMAAMALVGLCSALYAGRRWKD